MSTYAIDSNTMKRQRRLCGLKRIERHTNEELDLAIDKAARRFGDDFWLLLHGIDAYMERRKRRDDKKAQKDWDDAMAAITADLGWGQDNMEGIMS